MKNSPLITVLSDILTPYETIIFALLFGSQCGGNIRFDSDIDIAIYFKNTPDLLTLGEIIAKLEGATRRKIDLVVLNDFTLKIPFWHIILSENTTF